MGQLLLLSLSEVGQHIFEANINGAEALYELKVKFEMQIVSFGSEAPRKIFGTTPSTLAINVTNALLDSHKHLGKDIR